ncbi:MAG TPA: peroxiredoxin [Frankiaceae bacterium]|nr:peroxiredoxin [Frankiaceae bacterium]
MPSPEIGAEAPDFVLDGTSPEGRQSYVLSDLRGRPVVLAFYPGDETPVCTRQLCSYQDDMGRFAEFDALVLGISPQNLDSHERFAARRGLTFPLLADPDKTVARLYGVTGTLGIKRAVFVIDAEGVVRWKHVAALGLSYQDADTIAGVLRDLAAV